LSKFKQDIRKTSRLSLEFCLLWFFSNYFYNSGLSSTSVTSSTVLCNTSSIFVYLIGLVLLKDVKFEYFKALFVILSFTGIVIVTLTD
jgi:solute carrier family 35, member F5